MENAVACERCGTFVAPDAAFPVLRQRVCAACRDRFYAAVKLYSIPYAVVLGALFPPVGLVLAAINWWRVGHRWFALMPLPLLLVRLVAMRIPIQAEFPWAWLIQAVPSAVLMLAVMLPMQRHLRAHRAAGGKSASRLVPIGIVAVLLFCFVGAYGVFSRVPD